MFDEKLLKPGPAPCVEACACDATVDDEIAGAAVTDAPDASGWMDASVDGSLSGTDVIADAVGLLDATAPAGSEGAPTLYAGLAAVDVNEEEEEEDEDEGVIEGPERSANQSGERVRECERV